MNSRAFDKQSRDKHRKIATWNVPDFDNKAKNKPWNRN